jgi:gliding motility-associated lipoprotein GldD
MTLKKKRMPKPYKTLIAVLFSSFLLVSCSDTPSTPRPKGYFRLEPPSTEYQMLELDCPYAFDLNQAAEWQASKRVKCWGDIYYPDIKARVQLTYKPLKKMNDLPTFLEDSRDLAYKHVVKADGIREQLFSYADKDVHGIYYTIQGDAATSTQFIATDSTNHFIRGVLYFYAAPNADSLQPVNTYMQGEILHLIESLQWQKNS